jgi:hypothetical protein
MFTTSSLVIQYKCSHQYSHGLCIDCPTNTGYPKLKSWTPAENCSDLYIRRGRVVSTCHFGSLCYQSWFSCGACVTSYNHAHHRADSARTNEQHNSVCIVSILRLQSLVSISNSTDPTYDNPAAATWSSVEINVGIICSCLPLLRPLFNRFLPGVFTSRNRIDNVDPKNYATIRSTNSRKGSPSQDDSSLEMTKQSHDGGHEIQVVTDISVQVEGGTGRLSVWRASATNPEWNHRKGLGNNSSTKIPAKEACQLV